MSRSQILCARLRVTELTQHLTNVTSDSLSAAKFCILPASSAQNVHLGIIWRELCATTVAPYNSERHVVHRQQSTFSYTDRAATVDLRYRPDLRYTMDP